MCAFRGPNFNGFSATVPLAIRRHPQAYDKITWGYTLSKHFLDDLGNSAPSPEEVGPENEGRVRCVPEAVAAVDFPTGGCLVEEHATFRKG